MLSPRLLFGTLLISVFAPLAAHAEGRCILSQIESMESNRTKETLIIADHLDISYGAKESLYVSNDGTVRLAIKRTASRISSTDLQVSVLVAGATVFRSTGQSTGDLMGIQTAVLLADGRVLSLTCTAQP